jgi:hypothetical protein
MSSIHPLLKKIIRRDMERRPLFPDIREEHLPDWAKAHRAELLTLSRKTECSIIVNPVHPEYICGEDVNGVCSEHDLSHFK